MNTMKMTKAAIRRILPLSLLPVVAIHAASTETTTVVTIVKPDNVRISDVDDLVLGSFSSLSNSLTVLDALCVYSSSGAYGVTITSSNGDFALKDDETATTIPYAIDWLAGSLISVDYGSVLVGLSGDASNVDCGGSSNAGFQATVTAADFNAADPGDYSDTLTLLIQPE